MRRILSRLSLQLLFAAVLGLAFFVGSAEPAFAKGEHYQWGDKTRKTIVATGGVYGSQAVVIERTKQVSDVVDFGIAKFHCAALGKEDLQLFISVDSKEYKDLTTPTRIQSLLVQRSNGSLTSKCGMDTLDGQSTTTNNPNLTIANSADAPKSGDTSASSASAASSPTCKDSKSKEVCIKEGETTCASDAGALAWLLCPVIRVGTKTIEVIFNNVIADSLKVDPLAQTEQSNLRQIWAAMRNLADVLFALIFIVIIFANTLSLGIDNYTIKKSLPRLVAAAILVQFSFLLCGLIVDIGNVLGAGIPALLHNVNSALPASGDPSALAGAISTSLLTVVGIGAVAIVGVPLALVVVGGAVIGLIGTVLTIWFRVLIIDLLIVLSPLALAAWVLPNTESYFKKWYSMLTKTILMYPIIIFLFSASFLLSTVAGAGQGGFAANINAVVAGAFPIMAFFMIPATFKWAGGLMATVAGAVTGRFGKYRQSLEGSELAKRSRDQKTSNLRNLAMRQGISVGGKQRFTGLGGQTIGRVGTGTLLGRRALPNFNANLARASGILKENRFDQNRDAMDLLSMTNAEFEAAGTTARADNDTAKLQLIDQVKRFRGDSSVRAVAAVNFAKMGGDTEELRKRVLENQGATLAGDQVFRELASQNADSRPDLMFTDLKTGEVNHPRLLSYVQSQNQARQSNIKRDTWIQVLGNYQRDPASGAILKDTDGNALWVEDPAKVAAARNQLKDSNIGALLYGPGARVDAKSADIIYQATKITDKDGKGPDGAEPGTPPPPPTPGSTTNPTGSTP